MHYLVEGAPIPLARHRTANGHAYDSQKQLKYSVGIQLRQQHQDTPLFEGALHLEIIFFMPTPDRLRARVRKYIDERQGEARNAPHFCKPDLSNLIKFIEDVATGIIYTDDSIIAKITATKIYSAVARTEFSITRIDNND